jgi:integral membrane protein
MYLCKKINQLKISIHHFRRIGLLEAISFLLLLGIAMPLKYIWEYPNMVQVVGMAHGILFILYVLGAFIIAKELKWSTQTLLVVMACSVIPFGPFYAERKYLK